MSRAVKYVIAIFVLTLAFGLVLHSFQTSLTTNKFVAASNMQSARAGACSVQLPDGRVLIAGGEGPNGTLNSAEVFNASGQFTSVAPMLSAHAYQICVTLESGRVLVAGGLLSGGESSNAAEIYDAVQNTWSRVGAMVVGRSGATGALLKDQRVLIAGGENHGTALASIEIFDPAHNVFEILNAALSSARMDHAAAVLTDGRVLIAGGSNGSTPLDCVDVFDPRTGVLSSAGRLSVARSGLSATTLIDGKVLLAGGVGKSGDLAIAELYDPEKQTISLTASMQIARHGHQAFRLPDNNSVAMVGGTSSGAPSSAAELYVPWKREFRRLGDLSSPRTSATGAPVQKKGRLMVAGGRITTQTVSTADTMQYATVVTDRTDYSPYQTVTVTGTGWQPGETVNLDFAEVNGPDPDVLYSAVADATGNILDTEFSPDIHDPGIIFSLTASGVTSGLTAQTTFADANPDLSQCANGGVSTPQTDNGCTSAADWQNGNLNGSQAHFLEGDSVPYRTIYTGLTPGTEYVLQIDYETTDTGRHAIDYLTSYNRTETTADPCAGAGFTCGAASTIPIPSDPNLTVANGFNGTQIAGVFTIFGGTTPSGTEPYVLNGSYTGTSDTSIRINFTVADPNGNVVIAWGGHISTRLNWGQNNSAVTISGSPYHMILQLAGPTATCDVANPPSNTCGVGQQDRSLKTDAVIFPATITITKVATPKSSTSFPFTATPALPPSTTQTSSTFSLVDDGIVPADNLNTITFSLTTSASFTTYNVQELVPTGWNLTGLSCTVDSVSGSTESTNLGTATATITAKEAGVIACTYTDTEQGSIQIVKNTVGGDGTFAFTSNFGVSSITTSGGTGNQTVNNLTPGGSYSISETAQTGWDEGTFSCTNGTASAITVVAGQTTTCTITNTKQGSIKIVKNTVGGDGTFGFTSNFGVSSITTSGGSNSQTVNNLSAGSNYSISETTQTGWDEGTFSCTNGTSSAITVVAGQTTTCTITNTKSGSIKIVKNTVGGDGTFGFTSNFGVSSITTSGGSNSQTVNNLSAGSNYSISETAQTGWDEGTFTCSAGTAAAITVTAGQTTTCTITNTKQGAIKIVKNTVGGDGTFGFTSNFGVSSITTSGGSNSQTVNNLSAGSNYSISETAQTGWDEGTFTCSAGTAAAITVTAGQTTTCTITNTKQGAIKIVKNTVGGDGTFGFTSNFGVSSITTSGGSNSQTVNNLSAGSNYSISETAQTGWNEGAFSCSNGTASAITVVAGQTTTCTITNTKDATLTIVKNTIGGNGTFGFTTSGSGLSPFSLTTSSGTASTSFNNRTPGSGYAVSETGQTGWDLTNATCSNGSQLMAITLTAGQTTTCTFTNTARGYIIVQKVTNPSTDTTTSFTFTPSYGSSFNLVNAGSNTSPLLPPGNYSVSESALTGWDLTSSTCGTAGSPSSITLPAGSTVTCVFTNTERGKAQVVKTVNGAVPGPNDPPFSFDIRSGATPISSNGGTIGTVIDTLTTSSGNGTLAFPDFLVPGTTYQMCEMVIPGYSTTWPSGYAAFAIPDPNGTSPAWMCVNFTVSPSQTLVFDVNNVKPTTSGGASTIGFWKNWASCAGSNGGQKHILDETLYASMSESPVPYGPGITIGNLLLRDTSTNKDTATDCQQAVDILNKSTLDKSPKKDASDPGFNLAAQLLGAILNVDAGAAIDSNTSTAISEATLLLANHNFTGFVNSSYILFTGQDANLANYLATLLGNYNNNQPAPSSVEPYISSASSATFINLTASSFTVKAEGVPTPTIAETGTLPAGFTFTGGIGTATLTYSGAASPKKNTTITFTAASTAGVYTQTFTITVQ